MNKPFENNKDGEQITEHFLVSHLVDFLKTGGYRIRLEVPSMGQVTDVVATRGRWVTFIEAKISDWNRALQQCRAHEHVADFICVAIGSEGISEHLIQKAESLGYGIVHMDFEGDGFSWVLKPRLNRKVWTPQRNYWSKNLRLIHHEN